MRAPTLTVNGSAVLTKPVAARAPAGNASATAASAARPASLHHRPMQVSCPGASFMPPPPVVVHAIDPGEGHPLQPARAATSARDPVRLFALQTEGVRRQRELADAVARPDPT